MTTFELIFKRYYVAAIVDGFSRKLLALRVYRDAPTAANMIALVRDTIKQSGAPRFIVTDHGSQFRDKFVAELESETLNIVKGKVRSCQFNGKAERFFRTLKLWRRATLFFWNMASIQTKLDIFRNYYNNQPMWLHGGRTPEEVWSNTVLPPAKPVRANDAVKPAVNVSRLNFCGDRELPILNLTIIRELRSSA